MAGNLRYDLLAFSTATHQVPLLFSAGFPQHHGHRKHAAQLPATHRFGTEISLHRRKNSPLCNLLPRLLRIRKRSLKMTAAMAAAAQPSSSAKTFACKSALPDSAKTNSALFAIKWSSRSTHRRQDLISHPNCQYHMHLRNNCNVFSLNFTQARCDPVAMQQLRDKFLERCKAYRVC